jgi:hypothetical protein
MTKNFGIPFEKNRKNVKVKDEKGLVLLRFSFLRSRVVSGKHLLINAECRKPHWIRFVVFLGCEKERKKM